MAKKRLTDKGVRALRTSRKQEDFWDSLTPGLCMRVSGTTGRKVWMVRYRANGKHRRMKLGEFPHMGLSEARTEARDKLTEAEAGEDPAKVKQEEREADTSFRALAAEVLEARAMRTRESTQAERARLLEKEIFPEWAHREVSSITRREVVHLVERIVKRGSPVLANRTLALVRLIFNDGLRRGFPTLEANPAHMVEPPGEEEGRDRYLHVEELPAVWNATEPENPLTRAAFRLALVTGQRIGSVCAMRWDGIETNGTGALWTIPAKHFKGRRAHLVPLSPEAVEIVNGLREVSTSEEWVFPSRAGAKEPYLTNMGRALSRIRKRSGLEHWTLHDFRTTFRTHAVRSTEEDPPGLGVAAHVADAVLGHKEASLGFARYTGDRHRYLLAEKREALARWGQFVRRAVEGLR